MRIELTGEPDEVAGALTTLGDVFDLGVASEPALADDGLVVVTVQAQRSTMTLGEVESLIERGELEATLARRSASALPNEPSAR